MSRCTIDALVDVGHLIGCSIDLDLKLYVRSPAFAIACF